MQHIIDKPETEYLDGRAFPKVSPKRTHALVQGALGLILKRCGGNRGQSGPEWRFRVGAADGSDTVLIPDLAFVAIERLRALPVELREEPPFAPDIAVEIRSPHFRAALLQEKIRKYLATGAQLVLDVDPKSRSIIAHTQSASRTYAATETLQENPVPWLTFPVSEAFEELDLLD